MLEEYVIENCSQHLYHKAYTILSNAGFEVCRSYSPHTLAKFTWKNAKGREYIEIEFLPQTVIGRGEYQRMKKLVERLEAVVKPKFIETKVT